MLQKCQAVGQTMVMGRSKSFRVGFTLIELLVVIAIIAILAAILFPVFSQARAKARQAACLNNFKQVGTGMLQYTQDYDEFFPYNRFYGPAGAAYQNWKYGLLPYIRNLQVYECPEARAQIARLLGDTTRAYRGSPLDETWAHCHPNSPWYRNDPLCIVPQQANLWFPRGYTVNGAVFNLGAGVNPDGSGWATPPRHQAQLQVPAETIWLQDGRNYEPDTGPWALVRCWCAPPGDPYGGDVPDPASPCGYVRQYGWLINHLKGVIFTYADGHSKWTRLALAIDRNDWKWACLQRPGEQTFHPPGVQDYSPSTCGGVSDAQTCRSYAAGNIAAEYK